MGDISTGEKSSSFTPLRCCGGCALSSMTLVFFLFVLLIQVDGPSKPLKERNIFVKAINETNDPKELSKYLFQSGVAAKAVVDKLERMHSSECDYVLVSTESMSDSSYSLVSSRVSSEPMRFFEPMKKSISSDRTASHRRWLLNEMALFNLENSNDYLLELVKGKNKELRDEAVNAIARCGSPKLFEKILSLEEKNEELKELAHLVELRKRFGDTIGVKLFNLKKVRAYFHKIDGVLELAKEHPTRIDELFGYLKKWQDAAVNSAMAIVRLRRHDKNAFEVYYAAREASRFHAPRLDKEFFANAQNLKPQLLSLLKQSSGKERKKKLQALYGLAKTDVKELDKHFESYIFAKKDEFCEVAMDFMAKEMKTLSAPIFRRLIAKSYCRYKALSLLIEVGEAKDFNLFKSFLKHDNFRYRILAQRAYGRFGTAIEQEKAMLLAFSDAKHQVNFAAIASMEKTTAPSIRPQLKGIAKNGKHLHQRLYAAEVLGRAQKKEDVPLLIAALKDRYELLSKNEMSLSVLSLGTYWLAKKFLTDSPERGCRIARQRIAKHLENITKKDYGTDVSKWGKWLATQGNDG